MIGIAVLVAITATLALAADRPGGIDQDLLNRYQSRLTEGSNLRALVNAVTNNSIKSLALDRQKVIGHDRIVAFKLKDNGITDQRSSGRCWMFAGFNVLTPPMLEAIGQDEFELSQSYLAFYDKLEKANSYLEQIIRLRDKPLDDRLLQYILEDPIGDGGWWPYFTELVKKYGVVPKSAMPETQQSSNTGTATSLTTSLLRGFASELRRMHVEGKKEAALRTRKEEMLSDVYAMLIYNYGQPPEQFVFRHKQKTEKDEDSTKTEAASDTTAADSTKAESDDTADSTETKNETYLSETHTPRSFYDKYAAEHMRDWVVLTNCPSKPYDQLFELAESRNIWDSPDLTVLNLSVDKLKQYAHKSVLDSQAVWFACDVGMDNYGDSGIFMVDVYDYESVFGLDFSLTKSERIDFRDMTPNHAMTLMGFDTTEAGQPNKWLVENSWGAKAGEGGHWYMYDTWFDEFVLVVVVDKGILSDEDRARFEQTPVRIEAWEPFFRALRNLD
jgi:bleomycin hydrolase